MRQIRWIILSVILVVVITLIAVGDARVNQGSSFSGITASRVGKAAVVRRTYSGHRAVTAFTLPGPPCPSLSFQGLRPRLPLSSLPRGINVVSVLGRRIGGGVGGGSSNSPTGLSVLPGSQGMKRGIRKLMARRPWRVDLRTGKEIGGEARDIYDPSGDKGGEGSSIMRFFRAAIRKRAVQLLGLMVLAGGAVQAMGKSGGKNSGGGLGLLSRGSKRPTERFVRPAPEKTKPTSPLTPPTAKPIPEAQAPIPPTPKPSAESEKPLPTPAAPAPQQQKQQQEVIPPPPVAPPAAELQTPEIPSPVIPEGGGGAEGNKIDGLERQRWTPFRDFKSRFMKKMEEEAEKRAEEKQEVEKKNEMSGEEAQEGNKLGGIIEELKKEEALINGDKAKAENKEEGKAEEKGEETEASPKQKESEEKDQEEAPFFKIDRRGSVLANDEAEEGRKLDKVPSGPSVSIPTPGQLQNHPRHGSSFVSSVFRNVGPAVPRVDCVKLYKGEVKFASGSGVIFTPDGYLVTNSLLVRNALELKVTLSDGREYPAEVKGTDEVLDIAVLKIMKSPNQVQSPGPSQFVYAPIGDSDALQVGDWVMSIGSPKSPGPSVILGIVSGLTKTAAEVGRPETQVSFIQTDASFDSGVVGGPLVNEYGEVVGINSIGMTTSSTVQFSVPINQVKSAITDLANGKAVVHPSIGVEMMPVTPTLAAQLNQQSRNIEGQGQIHYIPEGGAVVVVNVLEDSPAQVAGLKNLDILLEIERRPIYRVEDAQAIIKSSGVGRDLEVKVLRRTQEVTLRVRTTDFLSLFRKQQAARRYPELNKRRSSSNSGGVEQNSSEEGREHGRGGNGAATARNGGEEGIVEDEQIPAPIVGDGGGGPQIGNERDMEQLDADVDQQLKGNLFVEYSDAV